MPTIVLYLSAALLLCAGFVLWLIRHAAEGHEEKDGFHRGPPDEAVNSQADGELEDASDDTRSPASSLKK